MGVPFEIVLPSSIGRLLATARAEVLEQGLESRLDRAVNVTVADDYDELAQKIRASKVDLAWVPPALIDGVRQNARVILHAARGGEGIARYRAALLVHEDSHLTLANLADKTAVWVSKDSTAGYLLPMAALRERNLEPDDVFANQRFVGSYRHAVLAVLNREADLCSVYVNRADEASVIESVTGLVGSRGEQLNAIAFSDESPSDALVITNRVEASEAKALVELLTSERCPALLLDVCSATAFIAED